MVTQKRWIVKEPDETIDRGKYKYSPYIMRILSNRGLGGEKEIQKFISPEMGDLYDPYLLPDMDRAVETIKKHVDVGENIVVYGDYDADGVTSTSILMNFFKCIGARADYYIPDRIDEGYGLNLEAMDSIINSGAGLIITVDCGITSVDEVSYCKSHGVDIIITDHHECKDVYPDTIVINAKRRDSKYPFRDLSGAGIAFKLVMALSRVFKGVDPLDYIGLAAIGTVADVVALMDENRVIVKYGLERMRTARSTGIDALINACGISKGSITSENISFTIAPRINAAGRIADASAGVKLFTCDESETAEMLAHALDEGNKKRQEIEEQILLEAEKQIEDKYGSEMDYVIVLSSPAWHVGVIGIVASRLVEKYYRPVIMLSGSDGTLRGSARSIPSFDMFKSLLYCSDLLDRFGGHSLAAGLSIQECRLDDFISKINNLAKSTLTPGDLVPSLYADCEISGDDISLQLINELKVLEPYGSGNPSPVFMMCNACLDDIRAVGILDKHLKFRISKDIKTFNAVAFNMGYNINGYFRNNKIDILFSPSLNSWNGRDEVQLIVKDMRHSSFAAIEHDYYMSLKDTIQSLAKPWNPEEDYTLPPFEELLREQVLCGTAHDSSLILVSRDSLVRDILNNGPLYEYSIGVNDAHSCRVPAVVINPDFDRISFEGFREIYIMDYLALYRYIESRPSVGEGIILHNCCKCLDDDLKFIMSFAPSGAVMDSIFSYLSGISEGGYVRCSVKMIADVLSLNLLCVYFNLKSMVREGIISMSGLKDDIILFRINLLNKKCREWPPCHSALQKSKGNTGLRDEFAAVFSNLGSLKVLTTTQLRGSNNGY